MGPALDHPAGRHHQDAIGIDHGRQAVCDDQGGVLRGNLGEGLLDRLLSTAVER